MSSNYCVYVIENNINYKCYVGLTSQLVEERFKEHIYRSKTNNATKFTIHKAINKYGKENFTIIPLDTCSNKNRAKKLERKWVRSLGTCEHGYNENEGGDVMRSGEEHPLYGVTGEDHPHYGNKHSEETKRKMSESMSGKNNPHYGGLSKELSEKLSDIRTGEGNPYAKLTESQAKEIKNLALKTDLSNMEIAKKFPVTHSTVSNIKNGKSWSHIKIN